jgi:uncharacterized protein YgbK (DUF1537 family)
MADWPTAQLVVGDASSPSELDAWIARLDPQTLPVGAAEFFAAWLASLRGAPSSNTNASAVADEGFESRRASATTAPGPRTLLVCGSPAAWFQGRAADARARDLPVMHWTVGTADSNRADGTLLRAARETLSTHGRLLVTCHGPEPAGGPTATTDVLLALLAGFARRILAPLLETVHPVDGQPLIERLLVEGGATTAALVNELDWVRFAAAAPVADGITPLIPWRATGDARGADEPRFADMRVTLFSKPGSYAWPADLW